MLGVLTWGKRSRKFGRGKNCSFQTQRDDSKYIWEMEAGKVNNKNAAYWQTLNKKTLNPFQNGRRSEETSKNNLV